MLPLLCAREAHIEPAHPDAQQDVEHGPAEAGAQRHDGETEPSDGDVCDEVAEGVSEGEDGEAEDGVAPVEDDADGFEDPDDFVGDGGDPGYGDGEADEAQRDVPLGGVGRGGEVEKEGEGDEGGEEGD